MRAPTDSGDSAALERWNPPKAKTAAHSSPVEWRIQRGMARTGGASERYFGFANTESANGGLIETCSIMIRCGMLTPPT